MTNPVQKICGFTGYVFADLPFQSDEKQVACVLLKILLYNEIEAAINDGYTHFISGFDLGSDVFFAEAVLRLQDRYSYITLEAALASETQSNDWTEEDRNRFYGLLSKCDKETYLSHRDHKEFHLDRNRYILGNSQLLIAIHDSKFGKTMYSVNRAKEKHVDLVVINPNTFQISKKYSSKRI